MRRFPSDFMFQMTKEDIEEWKSQIVISNSIKMGLRKSPKAFTLFGEAMLSSVLNSETAIDTNIDIMRAINTAIAELQVEHRKQPKRKPIGFVQPKDDDETIP